MLIYEFIKEAGTALADARKTKEDRYLELVQEGGRCKLVVAGMEVGGRWSEEAYDFLCQLASAKAREAPPLLQGSAYHTWKKRWASMLAVAGMRAFADTLVRATVSMTDVNNDT